jgi:hypothetical protein
MGKGKWVKGRESALWMLLAAGLRPANESVAFAFLGCAASIHVSRMRNSRNSGW